MKAEEHQSGEVLGRSGGSGTQGLSTGRTQWMAGHGDLANRPDPVLAPEALVH